MSDPWSGELDDPRRAHAPEPEYVPHERRPLWVRYRRLLPTIIVAVALLLALTAAIHHPRVYGTGVSRVLRPRPARSATCEHHRRPCAPTNRASR